MKQASVLDEIRRQLPGMQPGDAAVARVLHDDPEGAIYRSVSEIAELAGVSTATVVRCAQKLGFRGFQQLKLALAREYSPEAEESSAPPGVLEQVADRGARAVRDIAAMVDPEAFADAVRMLAGAGRTLFGGVGTSAPLVQDAAYRFRAIGLVTEAPADVHMQHVSARMLGGGDVCVAVSYSGATVETVDIVKAARAAGAKTIVLTSFQRSPLAELADIVLCAGSREVAFRLEAMASRLAHLALFDALLLACTEQDPERTGAALDRYADVVAAHRP